jgi:hypothetical protein
MREEFRKKIILIIDKIIDDEQPTAEDWRSSIIDKRTLIKKGLSNKEIDNIINYLKEKELVKSDSAIIKFGQAGSFDDDKIKTKENSVMSIRERYDFIQNNFVALVPDFEKLEEYKNKLFSLSIEEKKDNQINKKEKVKSSRKISYNIDSKILNFKDIEIDFSNSSKQADLLRTLFKDSKITWCNGDLWDDWKDEEENCPKKTHMFYTAALGINDKLAKKILINDFLKPRMKEIKINEKYQSDILDNS